MKKLKTKFYIVDTTTDTYDVYIYKHDINESTDDIAEALSFDSVLMAKTFINDNNFETWADIMRLRN